MILLLFYNVSPTLSNHYFHLKFCQSYKIIKKDRSLGVGGVFIGIKRSLELYKETLLATNVQAEMIGVKFVFIIITPMFILSAAWW